MLDLERLQALLGELRVGEGVLHRRVGGPHHSLAAGQMVRVRGLQPLPIAFGVEGEHRVGTVRPHQADHLPDQRLVGLDEAVPAVQEDDLPDAQHLGRRLLLLQTHTRGLLRAACGVEAPASRR